MASQVHVAVLWHMHQPWYALPGEGVNLLPWTRLRATKDYTDMAAWLERWPVPVTVNFTPSLTEQLRRYAAGLLTDRYLPSHGNPEAAADLQAGYIPLPVARRGLPTPDLARIRSARGEDGERTLWGWFLLAWLGQSVLEDDADLWGLGERGSFSSADVAALEERQREIVAEVLPRYRCLAEDAGIELTATPFYHPILPLVLDTTVARRCQPGDPIPRFSAPEDAREQVTRALHHHEATFGARPQGMWPAEGAVSPEAAHAFAEVGVRWIATDGGILARSLGRSPFPNELYQPWRFRAEGSEVLILFRDTYLSNLIGFDYHRWRPGEAVADLVQRLHGIGAAWHGARPPLVLIALDGENAWDYYEGNGRPFFESLYRRLRDERSLVPTTISDYLDRFGAHAMLSELWSGSWIDTDFQTWIGHPAQNRAWTALADVARAVADARPGPDRDQAREHLLVAEGSDWFWWHSPHHSSPQEPVFDRLFRAQLAAAYRQLGSIVPPALAV